MAFVYRAERKMNNAITEDNDLGPGEYLPDLTKTNSSYQEIKNIPFNSLSPRETTMFAQITTTPGPGTYEKPTPITDYSSPKHHSISHKHYNSNNEFYQAIQNNVIPSSLLYTLKKGNLIAFNSRSPRFKSSLNPNGEIPGPGKYNISHNLEMLSSSYENNKIQFNELPTTLSLNRIVTIPTKDIYGYDFTGDQPKIIGDPDADLKISGIKEDKVGPGQYDISPKWDKNIVHWSKMKEQKFRSTSNDDKRVISSYNTKNKAAKDINNINKGLKRKIFDIKKNERYEKFLKVKMKKEEQGDFLFDCIPGPGYYTIDANSRRFEKKVQQSFNVSSPRFIENKIDNPNIFPGLYEGLNKPKEKKKQNLKNNRLHSLNKDQITALKVTLEKNNVEGNVGPGSYEVSKSLVKEKVSSVQEFGIREKRFKDAPDSKNNIPGPGSYIDNDEFKFANEDDSKGNKGNKTSNDEDDILDRDIKHYEPPPVGTYNPSVVQSINYKIHSKINMFQDNKKVSFGTQDKRFHNTSRKRTNDDNPLVGPGLYYKNKTKVYKENLYPFNIANGRYSIKPKDLPHIGPGCYELSSFNDWNKKSHNILFI